jgi:hypothetical protein
MRHELGVLFVHGIGQQARGETLVQAADALHAYFDVRPGSADHVHLEGTELYPGEGPARARLRFARDPVTGTETAQSWLLAESWWAASFVPGGFGALVEWAVRVLPYAVLSHFGGRVRRDWARWRGKEAGASRLARTLVLSRSLAGLVLSPPLALAVMLVLIALSVLALIPVGILRAPAQWLQRTLAATLGDSQMLDTSETNRSAMIEKVRSDIRWLAGRTRRVAVVAHSQGAALSWEALLEQVPAGADRFLSLGSGLKKLLQLRVAGRPGRDSLWWAWTCAVAQFVAVALVWALAAPPGRDTLESALIQVAAWLALVFAATAPAAAYSVLASSRFVRWGRVLPGFATAVVVMAILLAWKLEPRWSWHAALAPALVAALGGVFATRAWLERLKTAADRWWMALAAAVGAVVPLGTLLEPDALFWQTWIVLAVSAAVLGTGLLGAVTEEPVAWDRVAGFVSGRGIEWTDWYASADPVPEGHFAGLGDKSVEVTNRASVVTDHTSYWENQDELVADVAAVLAGAAGWPLPRVPPAVKARRRWRVSVLAGARALAWPAIGLGLWLGWTELPGTGSKVLAYGTAAARLLPLDAGVELARELAAPGEGARLWLGVLAIALPVIALRSALGWYWRRWDRAEAGRAVRGAAFAPEKEPAFAWAVVVYVVALLFFVLPGWAWVASLPFAIVLRVVLKEWFARRAPPAPAA